MSSIEHIYGARSEPSALFTDLRKQYDTLVDEDDEIDWVVTGNGRAILFERKEASDLLRSFIDANEASGEPRVIAQLRRLQTTVFEGLPTLRVLLIERTIGQNRAGYATVDGGLIATKIPYNAIDNLLMVVQHWGIRVAHSTSLAHTPARIISIAESWLDTDEKEPIIMLPKAAPSQLRTLMTLPGVGIKRAKKVIEKYRNLQTALNAIIEEDEDWISDAGVRAKVAQYVSKAVSITWTHKK